MSERDDPQPVNGDFRIIRMDGLFHVVFRPAVDPSWFRIIASFFTYERAWAYCDVERVLSYEGESCTADEEAIGAFSSPPITVERHRTEADLAPMVRDIYGDGGDRPLPEPLPIEDFSDHPDTAGEDPEDPKDWHKRLHEQACAEIAKEADGPVCAECGGPRSAGSAALCRACYEKKTHPANVVEVELTERQEAVFRFFVTHANAEKLVNASIQQIAKGAGVPGGSMGFLLESLQRKQLIEVVERGSPTRSGVFRVKADAEVAA